MRLRPWVCGRCAWCATDFDSMRTTTRPQLPTAPHSFTQATRLLADQVAGVCKAPTEPTLLYLLELHSRKQVHARAAIAHEPIL